MRDHLAPELAAQLRPRRPWCVVGERCCGSVRRISEQGHGLCAYHGQLLEASGALELGPGLRIEVRRG